MALSPARVQNAQTSLSPSGTILSGTQFRGSTPYRAAVMTAWLGGSLIVANALGDWAALDFWLLASVWALCAMLLGPVVVLMLRVPVSVFEQRMVGVRQLQLPPPDLSAPLRRLWTSTHTLRVALESETEDVTPLAPDVWQWSNEVNQLPDDDQAVLRSLGLSAAPIYEALTELDDFEPAALIRRRTLIGQTLERFEAELGRQRVSVYR